MKLRFLSDELDEHLKLRNFFMPETIYMKRNRLDMMKRISILFLLLFAVFSCTDDEESNVFDFGEEKQFRVHEFYSDFSESLVFEISAISDSRCPTGVVCIWAGEARVEIAISSPEIDTLELSTHDQRTATSGDYTFELIDVTPYPDINADTKVEDYRVKMKIVR
ncbi:hypothetical protein [Draconibacterium mangrovi]|uniref:hypothetical protein n=1 Tax=Draconibacterium mangrovi TaxID=2697469 RepID=UPI0013D0AC19|nr:hypothetical protein [Draconibacterium mangrovi]